MSSFFKGAFWDSGLFTTSFFGGASEGGGEPPPPSSGATGSRYWRGSFWKPRLFSTTHFRGVAQAPAPEPPPVVERPSFGGASLFARLGDVKLPKRKPKTRKEPARRRALDPVLAAAIAEAEEDFF